jgi:uncharacterized membrane protein YphA (DoxX/SURF4 family)
MLVSKELNAAYWSLRIAFGLGPLIAGLDKFSNLLVNWEKYLSPTVQRMLPFNAVRFMQIVGGIEMVVGVAILLGASRVFGYIAMLWLWAIAADLISTGTYYDSGARHPVGNGRLCLGASDGSTPFHGLRRRSR